MAKKSLIDKTKNDQSKTKTNKPIKLKSHEKDQAKVKKKKTLNLTKTIPKPSNIKMNSNLKISKSSKNDHQHTNLRKTGSNSEKSQKKGTLTLEEQLVNISNEDYKKVAGSDGDEEDSDNEMKTARHLNTQQNKKNNKKSGGFQSMGLSFSVLGGVLKRGYKIPTPIQRKTIPIILERKDVVAMARTGSGKTAAFLIPLFERLKAHTVSGVRAIVMSPTRELALQTLKFAKEIGRFTNLKAAVILGGDRMDDQFAALHENPDIIIATPGRFLHVLVEMEMKLNSVEYVVFDEADRLYEMGFQDQLQELLNRLPESRQTLLFSATLPKSLVDFAKAGLSDPVLIRLDVDSKLSENLRMTFLHCRDSDKSALLMHLLKQVIPTNEQTIVFAATKHHVEFLQLLLTQAGLNTTYIYSSLDPTARKINAAKFSSGQCKILIVTDLAARGIDVPLLDNVINYNFPAKPKLFVHRVGRVARAGRTGTSFSIVCPEEMAYVVDLHVFLGQPLKPVILGQPPPQQDQNGTLGEVPQSLLDDEKEIVLQLIKDNVDLEGLEKVCTNAYKKYVKSRPLPANESIRHIKRLSLDGVKIGIHPLFAMATPEEMGLRLEMINKLKMYKPKTTIFEINSTSKKGSFEIMKAKREMHEEIINKNEQRRLEKEEALMKKKDEEEEGDLSPFASFAASSSKVLSEFSKKRKAETVEADDKDIDSVFGQVVTSKKKYKKTSGAKDKENFLQYLPSDYATERGLSIGATNSFDREVKEAVLDFTNDDTEVRPKKQRKWDRVKKKYVTDTSEQTKRKKMIKTESGVWIPGSYKSNAYDAWRNRNNADSINDVFGGKGGDDNDDDDNKGGKGRGGNSFKVVGYRGRMKHTKKQGEEADTSNRYNKGKFKKERKSADQILKDRKKAALVAHRQKGKKGKKVGGGGKKGGKKK